MNRRPPFLRWLAPAVGFFAGLPSVTGCYEYAAVRLDRVPVGETVRIEVSPEGLERLRAVEEGDPIRSGRTLTGEWLRRDGTSVTLSVRVPTGTDPFGSAPVMYRRVAVEVEEILTVRIRRLNRTKSALTALGAGALLAAAVSPFFAGEFGGTTKPTPLAPPWGGAAGRWPLPPGEGR